MPDVTLSDALEEAYASAPASAPIIDTLSIYWDGMVDGSGSPSVATEVYIYRGTTGDSTSAEGVLLKDFRLEDTGRWLISAEAPFDARTDSNNWNQDTLRQRVLYGNVYNIGGSQLRVTMMGGGDFGATLSGAYIGLADGVGPSFDGDPTQLLFSGSPVVTVPSWAELVSDPVDFVIPPRRSLIVSAHVDSGTANDVIAQNDTAYYWSSYTKLGVNEAATETVTGYTQAYNTARLVTKIESLHGAPLNAGEIVEFVNLPFDISLPAVLNEALAKGQLRIDGVGREVSRELLLAIEEGKSVQVTYRPYITGQELVGPEMANPIRFNLTNVVISGFTVQGDIVLPTHGNKRFPGEIYTAERFRSLAF